MSSFIKDWYYCIDNYFWPHIYWFVKMTPEEEQASIIDKWNLLDFKTLEWRWWTRPVLKEMPKFSNIPVSIARNNPMTRHTDSLHLWSDPDKLVKLSDVEEMIKKEMIKDSYWYDNTLYIDSAEILSSLSSLPTQNVPPIGEWIRVEEKNPPRDTPVYCYSIIHWWFQWLWTWDKHLFQAQYLWKELNAEWYMPLPLPPTN